MMLLLLLMLIAVTYSKAAVEIGNDLPLSVTGVADGPFSTNRENQVSAPVLGSEYIAANAAIEEHETLKFSDQVGNSQQQRGHILFNNSIQNNGSSSDGHENVEAFSIPIDPKESPTGKEEDIETGQDPIYENNDNDVDLLPKKDKLRGEIGFTADFEHEFGLGNETDDSYKNYFPYDISDENGENGISDNIVFEPLDVDDSDDEDLVTNSMDADEGNIDHEEYGVIELKRTKRSTWGNYRRRYCNKDVDCHTSECCMRDPLGPKPLALICWRRARNGYCARPMACRYQNDCRPHERCVVTRILYHWRYWMIRIGNCVSSHYRG